MPRVRHITRPGTPSAKALSGRLSSVEFLKSSLSAKAISTLLWAQCLLVRTSSLGQVDSVLASMFLGQCPDYQRTCSKALTLDTRRPPTSSTTSTLVKWLYALPRVRPTSMSTQTDERVRRALAGRARVESRSPECGERVFYFRKTKNSKRGCWIGPGTVIGKEGANFWVTRAGRCHRLVPSPLDPCVLMLLENDAQ